MPNFFVRVELHSLAHDHPNYNALHAAMKTAGFLRQAPFASGNRHLPNAEYFHVGQTADIATNVWTTVNAVIQGVKFETKTAFTTKILVVESAGYCATGLDLA
jgi:hypothetical protein